MTGLLKFFNEVKIELSRVRWPGRRDLVIYTTIVLFAVLVSSVLISLMDASFGYIVGSVVLSGV